ncbi:ScyD/ScyE family protein, partial [Nostoc sp. HG1]|nr:ScyD/ScyE family protein [Nostoc sp. HG1]
MKLKLLIIAILAVLAPQTVEAATFSIVADGLDNARGLSFAPDGTI